jgi:hypothetical protein
MREGCLATDEMGDPAFTMECSCGRVTRFGPAATSIECDCGAVYAVTITELSAPEDG